MSHQKKKKTPPSRVMHQNCKLVLRSAAKKNEAAFFGGTPCTAGRERMLQMVTSLFSRPLFCGTPCVHLQERERKHAHAASTCSWVCKVEVGQQPSPPNHPSSMMTKPNGITHSYRNSSRQTELFIPPPPPPGKSFSRSTRRDF